MAMGTPVRIRYPWLLLITLFFLSLCQLFHGNEIMNKLGRVHLDVYRYGYQYKNFESVEILYCCTRFMAWSPLNTNNYARKELGEDKAEIFAAHLLVLSDPELLTPIRDSSKNEQVNAEFALNEVATMFVNMFEAMDNEYMKERAADIRDVTKRVLSHLLAITITNPGMIAEEVIIIAEDLTPSDTAQSNRKYVKGFATDIGGRTSHSAIMARSMEIPAVVGTKTVTADIENGALVIR